MIVGFIGLGTMGAGMALNAIKAGFNLVVHDMRKQSAERHVAAGAKWAESVEEVGRSADVVFTSLPGPKEMQAVGVGECGLLGSMRQGSAWFDLTTNARETVLNMHGTFAKNGISVLDAPVSGGPAGANSGKLAIYVGGDHAVYERFKSVLDAMGDQAMYMGEVGAGSATKLALNCASFGMRMMMAEVFSLGVKAGVKPMDLWHAMRSGAIGRSRTYDRLGDQYLQDKYDPPNFALRLAHKDLRLALELSRQLDVPMRYAEVAFDDFSAAMERGWADADSRSPMQLANERAGVKIQVSAEDVKKELATG